jgi:secondary thiamine-phosphate synthase enzyme
MILEHAIMPTEEFTDITDIVNSDIDYTMVLQGLCLVYSRHTTACIRIIENETLLRQDMHDFLERLASSNCLYRHDDVDHRDVPPDERRNGFSHLRAMFLNHQELIPVVNRRLDLGKWQRVFYIECDPFRQDRTFHVKIIGGV